MIMGPKKGTIETHDKGGPKIGNGKSSCTE